MGFKLKNYLLAGSFLACSLLGYSQDSKLSENQKVLIYGESEHFSKKQKKYITNSIDSLKKQGYNYFAIEFHSKNNNSIQSYLKSNKKYRDSTINSYLDYKPTKMALNVCHKFYKKGFKVVPIDTAYFCECLEKLGDIFVKQANLIVQDFVNDPLGKKSKLDSLSEAFSKPDTLYINNYRDVYMAKSIEKILENDSLAKITVYVGAYHAREMDIPVKETCGSKKKITCISKHLPMAGILKNKGIDPETIYLEDKNTNQKAIRSLSINKDFDFDKKIYLK